MAKSYKNLATELRWYDFSAHTNEENIKFAKRAAKLANNRLYKLEKAGMTSTATTGGIKHIPRADINNKAAAARAIGKAKSLLANPISTPGAVNKLFKEAQEEYGKGGRMKFIAEEVPLYDERGEVKGYKLVPKAVPWGTNKDSVSWTDQSKMLKRFWTWVEKVGSSFFSSNDAYDIWEESGYNDKAAIKMAERTLHERESATWQQYQDQMTQTYGFGSWM